jgi:hypothetical protein
MRLAFAFLAAPVITTIDFPTAHKDSLGANLKVSLKLELTRRCHHGGMALFEIMYSFASEYVFMRYRYGSSIIST